MSGRSSRRRLYSKNSKYERCVMKVKSKLPPSCVENKEYGKLKGCYNPWAVCTKSVGRPEKLRSSRRRSGKRSLRRASKKLVVVKQSSKRRLKKVGKRRSRRSLKHK